MLLRQAAWHGGSIHQRLTLAASVTLTAVGLGGAPLARKAALESGADPLPLALATVAVAAVVAVGARRLGRTSRKPCRPPLSRWLHVALVGLLGSAAVTFLAIQAMTGTSATNRGLFQAMYPVATAVAARFMLGERLDRTAYAVIGFMTLGLLAMNADDGSLRLGTPFWLLLATLPLIGLSDVYARKTLDDVDPGFVTCGRLVAGALALGLTLPWIDDAQWRALLASAPWVAAAGGCTAAGLLGLYRAMNTTNASLAAAFAATAPVVTAIGEYLLLGATLSTLQLLGLATVVGGAVFLAVWE